MSERGLNDSDRERIAQFLSKPAYKRDIDDLRPADPDETEDASDDEGADGIADETDDRTPSVDATDGRRVDDEIDATERE